MIDMQSKYDNMHHNGMFYALIYIYKHVFLCYEFMLLTRRNREVVDFTQSRVNNNSKLTNLMKTIQIEGYNGK